MPAALRTLTIPVIRSRWFLFPAFAFITLAPLFMTHSQWITGPLVNAMLILTAVLVGPMEAVILGLFPSPVALSSGLLPLPLSPMLPFIMIGNAIFVSTFHYVRKVNVFTAVVAGALLKFLFLAASVRLVMSRMLAAPLVSNLSVMMSWPQLWTALIGGGIALALLRILGRRMENGKL